jgi:AcrR family transcriptional regulator
MSEPQALDRRQLRTRDAIRRAFMGLATNRRYDDFSVTDLITEAGIGRSTFYEHYRSKDEVLRALMDRMLGELAESTAGRVPQEKLRGLVSHFWDNRRLGKSVFGPQLGPAVRRRLTELIVERTGAGKARAAYLASGTIGLLFAWLTGEVAANPDEIAAILLNR